MAKYQLASNTWDSREEVAISRVLRSGQFTMGKEVSEFEDEFTQFLGVKHAIMVNSGSSANLIACSALRYSKKYPNTGTVIVPAVSWSTTFFPINQAGYKLKFIDINIETLNIDLDKLVENITEDVVGICGVSLLGNPSGMEKVRSICDKNDLFFFEDNCESLGASIHGKLAGSFGHVSSHSFFFSHHLQTMEGGMVCTDDDELAMLCRSLRAHGWTRDKKSGSLSNVKIDKFNQSFEFVLPGYCVRPIEFMGAVGKVQLSKWPEMKKFRLANSEKFIDIVSQFEEIIKIQDATGNVSSWFGFSMILQGKAHDKRNLLASILDKHAIEYRPIVAGNFTKQEVLCHLNCEPLKSYPAADLVHNQGIFVGNDARDLSQELLLLKNALIEFFGLI